MICLRQWCPRRFYVSWPRLGKNGGGGCLETWVLFFWYFHVYTNNIHEKWLDRFLKLWGKKMFRDVLRIYPVYIICIWYIRLIYHMIQIIHSTLPSNHGFDSQETNLNQLNGESRHLHPQNGESPLNVQYDDSVYQDDPFQTNKPTNHTNQPLQLCGQKTLPNHQWLGVK